MNAPEKTTEEQPSDLKRLESKLSSLIGTLSEFKNDISRLHGDVFREEVQPEKVSDVREEPMNKIIDLIDKVETCFDIQKVIKEKFNNFNNLLL